MPNSPNMSESRGYSADRGAVLNRLRRIQGQVRAVARMVEEQRYCIDVLTQIAAVRSALDGVSLGLLDAHVRHCVAHGDAGGLERRADELVDALTGAARPRYADEREELTERLRQLETRVAGIAAMVEVDRYCMDVVADVNAVKQVLDGVALGLVSSHVRSCMRAEAHDRDAAARELMIAVARLVKSS